MPQIGEALGQVARKIPDGAGEQMTRHVTRMVTVVRRRRATRTAARSIGGLGVAAIAAVVATSLGGWPTQEPGPSPAAVGPAQCGLTLEEAGWLPDGAVAELDQVVGDTTRATTSITISTRPGALPGHLAEADLPWFVAVDPTTKRIVGVQGNDEWSPLREPGALRLRMLAEESVQMLVELVPCSETPDGVLPVGQYDVYVLQGLRSETGGYLYALGGPTALAIREPLVPRSRSSAIDPTPSPGDPASPGTYNLEPASPDVGEEDLALVERLVTFALAPDDASAAALDLAPDGARLGLADRLLIDLPLTAAADPGAWELDVDTFRAFSGPFSPLAVLADHLRDAEREPRGPGGTTLAVNVGEHAHCVSEPVPPPAGLEAMRRVSVQPASNEMGCLGWFTVDLFVDDDRSIVAITMDVWEP